jgi:RHS repeat-associated protein
MARLTPAAGLGTSSLIIAHAAPYGTAPTVQWLDYAPYGSVIASENTGTTTAARQYIGQYSDTSGLSYLNARYYNGTQGGFISQDPVFLGTPSQQNLTDPQSLNSYSYADDNPIVKSDPNGKCPICILGLGLSAGYIYGLANEYEYDQGRGQTSSVSAYLDSGVKGIAEGGTTAASLIALGPVPALQYYGYYQTYQGLSNFNDQILSSNSTDYTSQQQSMTAGGVFLDALQRVADAFTPMPVRASYDAITSILNSLNQIYQTLSSLQTTQKTTNVQVNGVQPSQSASGGVTISNGQTPVHNSNGTTSYCLGVCGH